MQASHSDPKEGTHPEAWTRARTASPKQVQRPRDVPRPESTDEVALWAGSEDLRFTTLVLAPTFWVVLPLLAFGYLIAGTITDPGDGWTGNLFDKEGSGELWNFWQVWVGVTIWLLIAVAVLLLQLSVHADLRGENEWIFQHSTAHSIHRASVDYDDGEAPGWATYIALDHHLDDALAALIHEAFERWISSVGLPPSGSGPISSELLFGAAARGGYFFLQLPVSQTAGQTTDHRWMLITEPRDSGSELLVTPVPVGHKFRRLRGRARRRSARRSS